ncbi:AAA family ATPase [Pyrococcus kukulkanii]|uniref:AAA family ATPase n=1 Tax=Pyrococcus kukulkanii TaxID=1609559 RepID=UPI0035621CCA
MQVPVNGGSVLFNPRPKTRKDEFYDREFELMTLERAVEKKVGLVIVLGIRRLGKSSLVNVFLNESPYPGIRIDARQLYFQHKSVSPNALAKEILEGLIRISGIEKVKQLISGIRGVSFMGLSVEIKREHATLTEILERINEFGRFVLVIDEAQYLRFSKASYVDMLAWAIDELENVTFILTGSEVGLLEDLLRLHSPESPLFGRPYVEIKLERFSREQSLDFLKKGSEEVGIEVTPDELYEAVEELDGIVGWLTLYGYNRFLGLGHREALGRLKEDAVKIVLSEFSKLKELSPRYELIMRIVARGRHSWSEIKRSLEVIEGKKIDDRNFTNLLKNLVKYGYLEKTGEGYFIPDPLVEEAFR